MRELIVVVALVVGCKSRETYTSKVGSDEVFIEPQPGVPPTEDMVRVDAAKDGMTKEFYVDKFEVTARDYAHCVALRRCDAPARLGNCDDGAVDASTEPHRPINCVLPREAEMYCKYRGKRLPTQAEWQHAALGEGDRLFPWGTAPPSCTKAVLLIPHECAQGNPSDVGTHPEGASPFGAQDMVGNVSEIVFEPPVLHGDGDYGVMGGNYSTEPRFLARGLEEDQQPPIMFEPQIGFRCAWSADMLKNVKRAE